MAKFTPIRITENDRKEFAKLAKNAKSKINRSVKKYGTVAEQTVKDISIPKLEDFSTRSEYNHWKASIESFTNRNNQRFQFVKNEYGVTATKSYINEITRNDKKARRLAEQNMAKFESTPVYVAGKLQSSVKEERQMLARRNETGFGKLTPFDFKKVRSQNRLDTIARSREKQSDPSEYNRLLAEMKFNYVKTIMDVFNSDGDELAGMIQEMPDDDFYELYQMIREMKFTYMYDPDEKTGWINLITAYVNKYNRGLLSTDLKAVGGRSRTSK